MRKEGGLQAVPVVAVVAFTVAYPARNYGTSNTGPGSPAERYREEGMWRENYLRL